MTGDPLYPQTTTPIATPMPQSPDDGADDERNDDGGGDAE